MVVARRQWFQVPWEFRESALVTVCAVIAGFIIQYFLSGRGVVALHLPYNAIALAIFAISVLGIGIAFRGNPVVKWLGGIPLGLCLIVAIALLSLIGGVVPQGEVAAGSISAQLGLNKVFSGRPFAFIIVCFLLNLGLSLSWKLVPFNVRNIQFILFHAGFWIALSCGIFGAPDLQRLVVPIEEGKDNAFGYVMESEIPQRLPFAIFLKDFSLEEYPPNLLRYDTKNNEVLYNPSEPLIQVRKGIRASWDGVAVEVLEYLPFALPGQNGTPEPADRKAGIPFAKVKIVNGAAVSEEWISVPSPMFQPYTASLTADGVLLIMVPGTPRAFKSSVTIQGDDGGQMSALLEVNHPVDFMGWKLYQMGYDQKSGRWSQLSLVEAIRDPWLPAVYLGFFMIMAGNLLFFWNGIKKREVAS